MKNMAPVTLFVLALSLIAETSCAAKDHSVFGFKIGGSLNLPVCTFDDFRQTHAGQGMCVDRAVAIEGDYTGVASIKAAKGELPEWIFTTDNNGPEILVDIEKGKIVSFMIFTKASSYETTILQDLNKKYGEAKLDGALVTQTESGSTSTSNGYSWPASGLAVTYICQLDNDERGIIKITTHQHEAQESSERGHQAPKAL